MLARQVVTSVGEAVEEKEPHLIHGWWGYKLAQPVWKTVWRLLRKFKIQLPYDPIIPLLGIYLKKFKILTRKDTCAPVPPAVFFTVANAWKQLKRPFTEGWVKKTRCMYTMEPSSAIRGEREFCHLQQHGWTLRILCQAK